MVETATGKVFEDDRLLCSLRKEFTPLYLKMWERTQAHARERDRLRSLGYLQ